MVVLIFRIRCTILLKKIEFYKRKAKKKSSEKLTTTRACFDQVLSLKAILARFEKHHLDKVEVEIDSLIDEKLRLVSKIEEQDSFEELMYSVSDVKSILSSLDAQLDPYLAPLAKRKLLERSSIYFINKITGAILGESSLSICLFFIKLNGS